MPFPPGTILDDLYLPLHVIKSGKRVVFESKALVFDNSAPYRREFHRKVRTLTGNYQLIRLAPWVLTRSNPVLFEFVSHKLFRLWVPFALGTILVTSWFLDGLVYDLAFSAQILSYGLAVLSLTRVKLGLFNRPANVIFTLVMLNAAAVVALVYFIRKKEAIW